MKRHNRSRSFKLAAALFPVVCATLFISQSALGADNAHQENLSSVSQSGESPYYRKGDAVRIAVSSDTTHFVNGTYHIDDNGFVFLPVIGKVKIDSMTEKSFVSLLNSSYLSFLRYPTIQVHSLMRVSLLGGFAKPGLFYIDPSASLWDAIALAGGPVREDGLKKINWEREGQIVDKNLLPSIESGKSLSTLGMRSGDQLWITHVPKKDGWEIFSSEYLPVISVAVSALATTATLFIVYQTYRK